jgi:hypothetical protein
VNEGQENKERELIAEITALSKHSECIKNSNDHLFREI